MKKYLIIIAAAALLPGCLNLNLTGWHTLKGIQVDSCPKDGTKCKTVCKQPNSKDGCSVKVEGWLVLYGQKRGRFESLTVTKTKCPRSKASVLKKRESGQFLYYYSFRAGDELLRLTTKEGFKDYRIREKGDNFHLVSVGSAKGHYTVTHRIYN